MQAHLRALLQGQLQAVALDEDLLQVVDFGLSRLRPLPQLVRLLLVPIVRRRRLVHRANTTSMPDQKHASHRKLNVAHLLGFADLTIRLLADLIQLGLQPVDLRLCSRELLAARSGCLNPHSVQLRLSSLQRLARLLSAKDASILACGGGLPAERPSKHASHTIARDDSTISPFSC